MFTVKHRYFFILLLALYSYANIGFSEVRTYYRLPGSPTMLILVFIALSAAIWEGNRLIYLALERWRPFIRPVHTLLLHFTVSIVFSVIVSVVIAFTPAHYIYRVGPAQMPIILKLAITLGTRVNLFLHVVNTIFFYSSRLKAKETEAEALKRSHAQAELQAIRNQLNPHFLFNNLNILSTLVLQERPEANRFIEEFSIVYRHVINAQHQELVPLGDELEFIGHYIFLIDQRFPDSVRIDIEVPPDHLSRLIVPVALQLLIENALKHNIASTTHPLHIRIGIGKDGMLQVANNLQPKTAVESSTNIGLSNIAQRYQLISRQEINIKRTDTSFCVSLPLIETLP